ncbi:MAG TPA: hypothetical protein IAB86_05475 [Candidatus Aphodovivens avicola]|nr:hypothetical protein [Candidatus Aphodovivens avicola]
MRRGNQRPTFEVVGKYASTSGRECAELFEAYAVEFYPSQKYELDLFLARDAGGRAASKTIGISKPRQNGKSFAARHYALWMAAVEGKHVLYTAHHGNTTREMFKLIRNFVESVPDFANELGGDSIKRAQGNESVNFANGGSIEFNTRTNAVARGKTFDVIVVDEAQELTDEQADALTPTTIASDSGDPQMIYLGTPPNAKCPGTVFRRLHNDAHDGKSGDAWWLEWAATEIGDRYDVDRWYRCCPAMGYRIREDVMRDAADKSSDDGFAREYLGWWSNDASEIEHVISARAWALCETDDPPTDGIMCAGVKFGSDRTTLSACVRPKDGAPYVEWVDTRPLADGIGWCAEWLDSRRSRIASVAIDGGNSAALTTRLADIGFPRKAVEVARPSDMARAVSMLTNAVNERDLAHYGQDELTDSATKCAKRRIDQDGVGFADASGADATLIESCALALWQALTTKRRPGRKMRVG